VEIGDRAWGNLQLQVDVASIDNNTVLTINAADTSAVESFMVDVDIEPRPDPAQLTREFDGIISSNGVDLAMGLTVLPVNPAPGETTKLQFSGLPSAFSFNQGSRIGGTWVIDLADDSALDGLADLRLLTDSGDPSTEDPSGDFNLQINTITSLDGIEARSNNQLMSIKIAPAGDNELVGTKGDDYYQGAAGADTFIFSDQDEGNALQPNRDLINDFNSSAGNYDPLEGDQLDLSGLFSDMDIDDGATAAQVIDVSDTAGGTRFNIRVDGALFVNQSIELDDVSRGDLVASFTDEADFLKQIIENNVLLVQ
jgi:hypothetical protein